MKLSQYAKQIGVCYRTAWNYYKANQIPGAYELPSGTIIVPDEINQQNQNMVLYYMQEHLHQRINIYQIHKFNGQKNMQYLKVIK